MGNLRAVIAGLSRREQAVALTAAVLGWLVAAASHAATHWLAGSSGCPPLLPPGPIV